jgi:hypothetical protein
MPQQRYNIEEGIWSAGHLLIYGPMKIHNILLGEIKGHQIYIHMLNYVSVKVTINHISGARFLMAG